MTPDHRLASRRVIVARKYLAKGIALTHVARACGIPAADLDVYLWRTLGLTNEQVAKGGWLNIPA